jgi:epoxyqueuosine reductase
VIDKETITDLARECGFDLAGVAAAVPLEREMEWYRRWAAAGFAGEMKYLTDRRGEVRADPRRLLPSARSVICVGMLYNGPEPGTGAAGDAERAWISRYAWGEDYHEILRARLEALAARLRERAGEFEYRVCVDTAPLLERAYARRAGLGWIGRNGCLIHERGGSWYFLGEMLVSLALAPDTPPPDRCGTCTRCIDACPTAAIIPAPDGKGPEYTLDARLCISYLTIERRGPLAPEDAARTGQHVFGCDICQDVCPWNERAPVTAEPAFAARHFAPPLERLADMPEEAFRRMFRHSPVLRARYAGFLRNAAAAMGNAGLEKFREPLARLAQSEDAGIAGAARDSLRRLDGARTPATGRRAPQRLQEHQGGAEGEPAEDNHNRFRGHDDPNIGGTGGKV